MGINDVNWNEDGHQLSTSGPAQMILIRPKIRYATKMESSCALLSV